MPLGRDRRSPVPTIDITPFTTGQAAGQIGVVDDVRAACEDIGFFVTTGHGIPEALVARIYDASRTFFDLPAEEKNAIGETGPVMGGLMHFALGKEALAATLGNRTIGDLKETLDFGPGFWGDGWPANPPDLEPAWREYYRSMSELAATLRRIFAAAIGLEADYFEDKFQGHLSSLRVVDYPEQPVPPAPGQLRAGAHSDYGVLTILRTEDAPGGLQVCTRAGCWTDVPHIAGSFVVNIGDAMMRWTNDRWVSTPHRVVNPPTDPGQPTRRQSIAYFHNLPHDTVIECLPPFREAGTPPKYPAITYGEYAELRYRQAHGDGKRLNLASDAPSPGANSLPVS
ncbi:MAG: isopenicillin N synthase family oxygenase [Rhodospirillales bacterium]|nr:isopenicillin N synthase family oxygenase [Rhodospirillales bacterium]